jgi:predicted small lipoprotein YifL
MRKRAIVLTAVVTLLALAGCGRKEPPVPMAVSAPPAIVSIKHSVHVNTLELDLVLTGGGEGGVGYQIDRAPIDPYCNCPGFWRRYREVPAQRALVGANTKVLIDLRGGTIAYAYRIRAVDAIGRLGPWSKIIQARSTLNVPE